MSFIQQIENEQYEAAYNPQDRFFGFDRGDLGNDEDYGCDQGERVIGRMTSEAGLRVVIVEQYCDDLRNYQVLVSGRCVFEEPDDRARAITVARWWMDGCPV